MIRIFLAGEGRNELGSLWVEEAFRPGRPEPGVLEALLRQVRADGWEVIGAVRWTRLTKLQVGIGKKGEEQNVRRAFHHARKRGCDVLVFSRDRDGPRFAHREEDIERAISSLSSEHEGTAIVGAVAVEKLEAWMLAVSGTRRSEELRRPEDHLTEAGIPPKDTAAMVALVERLGLTSIPPDAASLRRWLALAAEALGPGARP